MTTQLISASFIPDTPGMYAGLPFSEYLKAPGYSKSWLQVLSRSPRDAELIMSGKMQHEETPAMQFGTALHSLVFENREDFYVRPDTYGTSGKPWNGNATECKAWLAEHSNKPVFSPDIASQLFSASNYVRNHPLAKPLLAEGSSEVSIFARAEETGYMLKGRVDRLRINQDGSADVIDLKSTTDASTRAFSREILKRRYHVQAAMYRRILQRLGIEEVRFTLLALEKSTPTKLNVRQLAKQAIDHGDGVLDADLELLKKCRLSNVWPEWPDQEDHVLCIDLPDFIYGDVDELIGMTGATAEAA